MKMLTNKRLINLIIIFSLPLIYLLIIFHERYNNISLPTTWTNFQTPEQYFLRNKSFLTIKNESTYMKSRVIVSLTSFSSRLDYIDDTLQSIFRQTFPFNQIYLSIPIQNYARYNLSPLSPTSIIGIQQKYEGKRLTVIESIDYGPSTKLLGVLQKERSPETIIVTIDDDTIYHPQVIEHLVSALISLKTNSSVAVVCETVFKQQHKWHWIATDVQNNFCKHGYLAAFAGAAYRRKYFDQSIFDYEHVPQGCILHDDVYISGYLSRKGIHPYIINPFSRTTDYPWSVIKHKRPTNLTVGSSKDLHKKQMDCIKHFNYFH